MARSVGALVDAPPGALEVAVEVGAIASASVSIEERAQALLEQLRRLVPFSFGRFAVVSPDLRERWLLAGHGPQEALSAYFDSPIVVQDMEMLGLGRPHPPFCLRDFPMSRSEIQGWDEFLWPAGFREGLAIDLFTDGDRHVGTVSLFTDSPEYPSDQVRDFIAMLAPTIAHAVDPLQSLAAAANIVAGARAGTIVMADGAPVGLPGLPAHPLLGPGSPVLRVAVEQVAAGVTYDSFLCPDRTAAARYVRMTVMACAAQQGYRHAAVVIVSPAGDLGGLTPRELEIAGLLVEGWPDERIALALMITPRTAAAHLEHIRVKLAVRTRTAAAAQLLRTGLYVPRALTAPDNGPCLGAQRVERPSVRADAWNPPA